MTPPDENLRSRVLRGGMYLTVRHGAGISIHLGGVILLTRTIGPESYGLYAAALAITMYLFELNQWGVGIYLVRRRGTLTREILRQASTLLLLLAVVGLVVGQAVVPLILEWTGIGGLGAVARVMILGVPVMLLSAVPLAALESALDYRSVAWLELGGLLIFYGTALGLAFAGYGAWAPVVGWWLQQVVLLAALHAAARYTPIPFWSRSAAKEMVSYGLSFSASMWIWQLRILVNPLIVGRALGAEAVGFVAVTHQIIRNLGFVMTATWRLSTAALARVQDDALRLVQAVNEGMQLQTLAVGPPLVLFAWMAPLLMPLLFGREWAPVAGLFPLVAFGYLTNAIFNLHSSALYVQEWNWDVARFHAVHVLLFAGTAAILAGPVGLVGYGWAELAAIPSYLLIHEAVRRRYAAPSYSAGGRWWLAFGLALFAHELGWWVAAAPVVVLLLPSTRRRLTQQWRELRSITIG